mgnify:CR=1 FL=1
MKDNILNKVKKLAWGVIPFYLFVLLPLMTSCSDDDSNGGQPVIERVRLTDPEKADSAFTVASLGQMILIEGRNLGGATHVYINNQDCGFNCNYNTSTHIIVTIPYKLIVYGQDNSLPMEIRVETNHGTAVYAFHVIAGVPVIDYYKADMPLNSEGVPEMQPGQMVELHGSLFHEIENIYVADLDTVKIADCPSWEVDDSCKVAYVTMPDVIPAQGIIVMECFAGTAYCRFSKSPMAPELTGVYPDMPIPGQTVTLTGKYLTDLTAINIGGEIDIDIDDVKVSDAQVTFKMPDQLPTTAANGTIKLKTLGGVAELPFYRYDWILEDFDGNGTNQNWNWGTDVRGAWWDAASFTVEPASGGWIGFEAYAGWWDHNIQFNGKQAPAGIDASTPLSDLELRYEVYLPQMPDATCYTQITFMGGTVDRTDIADHYTGKTLVGEWMSVAIPLTKFGEGTYGDLVGAAPGDDGNFKIYHDFESREGVWFAVAYDNFRIYKIK